MMTTTSATAGYGEHRAAGGGARGEEGRIRWSTATGGPTGSIADAAAAKDDDASLVGTKVRKPYTITKAREGWTDKEHHKFLEALKLYGRAWRRIEEHIGTKTAVQIRSHAQKFFSKVEKDHHHLVAAAAAGGGRIDTGVAMVQALLIDIPPPRPKRKPSHPYPRKARGNAPAASKHSEDDDDTPVVNSSLAAVLVTEIPKDAVGKINPRQEDDDTPVVNSSSAGVLVTEKPKDGFGKISPRQEYHDDDDDATEEVCEERSSPDALPNKDDISVEEKQLPAAVAPPPPVQEVLPSEVPPPWVPFPAFHQFPPQWSSSCFFQNQVPLNPNQHPACQSFEDWNQFAGLPMPRAHPPPSYLPPTTGSENEEGVSKATMAVAASAWWAFTQSCLASPFAMAAAMGALYNPHMATMPSPPLLFPQGKWVQQTRLQNPEPAGEEEEKEDMLSELQTPEEVPTTAKELLCSSSGHGLVRSSAAARRAEKRARQLQEAKTRRGTAMGSSSSSAGSSDVCVSCSSPPRAGKSFSKPERGGDGRSRESELVNHHHSGEPICTSPLSAGGSSPTEQLHKRALHKLKSQLSGLVQKELSSSACTRSSGDEEDDGGEEESRSNDGGILAENTSSAEEGGDGGGGPSSNSSACGNLRESNDHLGSSDGSSDVLQMSITMSSGAQVAKGAAEAHWSPKRTKDTKRRERDGEECSATFNWLTVRTEFSGHLKQVKDDSEHPHCNLHQEDSHLQKQQILTQNTDLFLPSRKEKLVIASSKVDDTRSSAFRELSSEPLSGNNSFHHTLLSFPMALSISSGTAALSTVSSISSLKYSSVGFVPYRRASS